MESKYDDATALEMAHIVAGAALHDYAGLTLGDEKRAVSEEQLRFRIVRLLMAFHYREMHGEFNAEEFSQIVELAAMDGDGPQCEVPNS